MLIKVFRLDENENKKTNKTESISFEDIIKSIDWKMDWKASSNRLEKLLNNDENFWWYNLLPDDIIDIFDNFLMDYLKDEKNINNNVKNSVEDKGNIKNTEKERKEISLEDENFYDNLEKTIKKEKEKRRLREEISELSKETKILIWKFDRIEKIRDKYKKYYTDTNEYNNSDKVFKRIEKDLSLLWKEIGRIGKIITTKKDILEKIND